MGAFDGAFDGPFDSDRPFNIDGTLDRTFNRIFDRTFNRTFWAIEQNRHNRESYRIFLFRILYTEYSTRCSIECSAKFFIEHFLKCSTSRPLSPARLSSAVARRCS